ncbi:hypothetical protein [Stieleria sp.]|uniref:hypothetical protein n=1 Tax=Stieleria sp. TaxID=2795976 RepID=UPI0035698C22
MTLLCTRPNADVNACDLHSQTPLHVACETGHAGCVLSLRRTRRQTGVTRTPGKP